MIGEQERHKKFCQYSKSDNEITRLWVSLSYFKDFWAKYGQARLQYCHCRPRQEDHEFEISQGNTVRSHDIKKDSRTRAHLDTHLTHETRQSFLTYLVALYHTCLLLNLSLYIKLHHFLIFTREPWVNDWNHDIKNITISWKNALWMRQEVPWHNCSSTRSQKRLPFLLSQSLVLCTQ